MAVARTRQGSRWGARCSWAKSTLALAAAAGCYSPYVLPSVGFDQTAARLPAHGAEVSAGGGYQLDDSAAPRQPRSVNELLTGAAAATFSLRSMDLVAAVGPGGGEIGLKIGLPVRAFDLAVQPEAGAAGSWTWQAGAEAPQGSGTVSGGFDLLASRPLSPRVTLYGAVRALGIVSATGAALGGVGVGIECRWGPVLLRPEVAASELFGFDGSSQLFVFPHLSLAVRP